MMTISANVRKHTNSKLNDKTECRTQKTRYIFVTRLTKGYSLVVAISICKYKKMIF
jgi:hypothetical protein